MKEKKAVKALIVIFLMIVATAGVIFFMLRQLSQPPRVSESPITIQDLIKAAKQNKEANEKENARLEKICGKGNVFWHNGHPQNACLDYSKAP